MKNKKLLFALIFPILLMALMAGYKQYIVFVGKELILKIKGFDPRDLLSGHYLIYEIDYNDRNSQGEFCNRQHQRKRNSIKSFACINKTSYGSGDNDGDNYVETTFYTGTRNPKYTKCDFHIVGEGKNRRFYAGIERFYIPEKDAIILDRLVRNSKGKIVLKVTNTGKVTIKDLLIENINWKDYIKKMAEEKAQQIRWFSSKWFDYKRRSSNVLGTRQLPIIYTPLK